jgi:hypothetical protein
MLKSDVLKFLKDVNRIYPSWKIDDYQETVDIWFRFLEKEEIEHCEKALDEYVTVERNKFAPSVSDIINLAQKYKPDPRFEGIDYWERRTKSLYPYEWKSEVYREWYTTDRESQRFFNYLQGGVDAVESGRVKEDQLRDLESVIKVYEAKKCLMMKKG